MTIVHLKTQVTVHFGELDSEGNVKALQPITYTTGTFSPVSIADGFQQLSAERGKLEADRNKKPKQPSVEQA